MDDDDLRKVRTLADELCIVLLLERDTNEAFCLVCIELGIVAYHLCNSDRLESCEFCEPWICLAILLLESLEVVDGVFCKVIQMVLHLVHLVLDAAELLVHSLCVELRDLPHRLLHELVDVLGSDRPLEKTLVFHHLVEHLLQLCLPCLGVTLKDLIYLVLEEYLLERTVVPVVLELVETDLELLTEQALCMVCAILEDVLHRKELRLVIHDHAGIRRDRHLAVCESIERVDGLVRRHIIRKMYHDLGCRSGQIVDLLDLDLSLLLGLENRLNDYVSRLSEWYLVD